MPICPFAEKKDPRCFVTQRTPEAFDMADHLKSDRDIARYLTIVLKEGDTDELVRALGHAARARGMADVARDSGLGRESLYKALRPGAHPRFETILRVCTALGIRLEARA